MKKIGHLSLALLVCFAFVGCGGSGKSSNKSNPTLTSISVSGAVSVAAGLTQQFSANGIYSDGTSSNLTSQVTWKTSDTTVASISSSGMLTALKQGSVTVTAAMSSITGNLSVTVSAPLLASIRVNPASFSIAAGQPKQLAASGVFTDGSVQDVTAQATWSSNATNVVTVSPTGLATGAGQGTATVTAAVGSISGTANANVGPAVLTSITVTPPSASVASGETQSFAANGIFTDGSSTDITGGVTWSSSSTTFASVDATGLATGRAQGSASITATLGTISGSATLTITAAKLTSIDITPDGDSIPVGGQDQLLLTGTFSDGTTQTVTDATWSSSDSTLASVDPNTGLVTGVADSGGNPVTITAQAGGLTNTTTIYVTSAVPESISITPATASIAAGTTQQFAVNGVFSDGSIQPLTAGLSWSSSAPSVAGINSSGLAAGAAPGQTTITVTYGSMTATATLTVTAATLTSIVVTPPLPVIGVNGDIQFTATGVFSDNSTQDLTAQVTWSSSTASVALISSIGLASALNNGTTTISASYQGVSGSATLTVTTATLVSIAVLPANPIVPPRTKLQMTAIGTFSDGTTVPLSGVTWYTNTGRYASVSGSGVVRTKHTTNQSVPVYARLNGIVGHTSVTITSMSLTSLQIAPVKPTMAVGTTLQFQLIGTFSDGVTTVDLTKSARWQTSNFRTAVISRSALAMGLAPGSVTITASYGSLAPATTTLTVSNATLQSITVTPAAPAVAVGGLQPFKATGNFTDGSTQDITSVCTWTSSVPTVAIVDKTGLATSVTQGTTNISASFQGVSGSATLTVN